MGIKEIELRKPIQKKYLIAAFLFASPFSSIEVQAQYRNYCISAYTLAPKIQVCPDNRIFTSAADECMEKFKEEINEVTGLLQGVYASNHKSSARAQNTKMENNGNNLGQTDKGLQYLIKIAQRIKKDLSLYVTTITLPGNPSAAMLSSLNVYDILADTDCYRDNRKALEAHIRWVNVKISELETADKNATALNSDSNFLQDRLGSINSTDFQSSGSVTRPKNQEKGFRKTASDVSEDPNLVSKKKKKKKRRD